MRTLLSIWLSAVLLTTGLPMPGMAGHAWTEPAAVQEEADAQEKEMPEGQEKEGDVSEGSAEAPEEAKEPDEAATETETPGQEGEKQQEKEPVLKEEKEQKKKDEAQGKPETEEEDKKRDSKQEKAEPKKEQDKEPAQEGTGEPLEAVREDRQDALIEVDLDQYKDSSCLLLDNGETVKPRNKTGYHTQVSRKVNCTHTASTISASIKCKKAARPLNPTRNELKNGVVLTGKLRGKNYVSKLVADDKGGNANTVTHFRLEVELEDQGIKELLAGPYVCRDGYAAFAYFEKHFTYCPNTEEFYKVGESHVWLGCTGGDAGTQEYHPRQYSHKFNLYKYVPNKYTVTYDENGGTGKPTNNNATYDIPFNLREGGRLQREGYTLTGWNTKADGTGRNYGLGQQVSNLTATKGGTVTLYAKWRPNKLTIKYNANGGTPSLNAALDINTFSVRLDYGAGVKNLANFSSFGLTRVGYTRKDGAEWNIRPNGTGRGFDEDKDYELTDYAPELKNGDREIIVFAQWTPNVYTVTLDNKLTEPETPGTGKIYKKFDTGLYLDSECSKILSSETMITKPQKAGYQFSGYYDSDGKRMIDKNGNDTILAKSKIYNAGHETWYARYDYLVNCEDYADIPCDLEKMSGDNREDPGIKLTYNETTRTVTAKTSQPGCSIHLIAEPLGTKVGTHTSTLAAGSASAISGSASTSVEIRMAIPDGAAYWVEAVKNDKMIYGFQAYYKDGRFRTLAKLGEQEPKTVTTGGSIAGSAWNKGTEEYGLYNYHGCSGLTDVKEPGTVCRYFRYKDVNMAYSGDGATAGKNTLEYGISLEDMYQFRDNGFTKEKTETKRTEDNEPYECKVRYSFQGWQMGWKDSAIKEKHQEYESKVYEEAKRVGAISDRTTEDISTYQTAEPIRALLGLPGNGRAMQGSWEGSIRAAAPEKAHAKEYINLTPKWDAYPTITVTPGKKLEFYEGEEVTKEDLINCLIAHDNEDSNRSHPYLNDKLRIVKVIYPEPENRSQAAYEKTYEKDVPAGFLLDTYYLKLEEDETVDVLVTFAVTDSADNTTEEEIPVKVKYNHYPEISSEDVFYYLKEEANRGEITESALLGRASAKDEEDGDITVKIALKDFDAQEIKMQTQAKAEFDVTYQVTDAFQKTSYKTVKLMVWDGDAAAAEAPKYYVRYISEKYLDTLEENSTWREPENMDYLKAILGNETPMETWEFTHEDVLDVQGWITEGGDGNWKTGREANREFLTKFARCKQ